jgi:hypothetical protein
VSTHFSKQAKKKVFIKKLLAVWDIFVDTFAKEALSSFNGTPKVKKRSVESKS